MPKNTTGQEDSIITNAEDFMTAVADFDANDLISIIERLDDELTTATDHVKELESDLAKAEERIAELEAAA
jgi:uncharacterized protein (UPF0335 family)